jgi:hypothetical protein
MHTKFLALAVPLSEYKKGAIILPLIVAALGILYSEWLYRNRQFPPPTVEQLQVFEGYMSSTIYRGYRYIELKVSRNKVIQLRACTGYYAEHPGYMEYGPAQPIWEKVEGKPVKFEWLQLPSGKGVLVSIDIIYPKEKILDRNTCLRELADYSVRAKNRFQLWPDIICYLMILFTTAFTYLLPIEYKTKKSLRE